MCGGVTILVSLAAVVFAAGCGTTDPLGFTPVEGRVTLDGQPVECGEIRFVPDTGRGNSGPMSASPLGKDGRFRLRGPGVRIGAIPGPHRAYLVSPDPSAAADPMLLIDGTLTAADGASAGARPGRRIPPRFLALESSGMTADVTAGKVNELSFELVSPVNPRNSPAP